MWGTIEKSLNHGEDGEIGAGREFEKMQPRQGANASDAEVQCPMKGYESDQAYGRVSAPIPTQKKELRCINGLIGREVWSQLQVSFLNFQS